MEKALGDHSQGILYEKCVNNEQRKECGLNLRKTYRNFTDVV